MGCMNKEALLEARGRLEAFLQPLLPLLGRAERRRHGALYLQGLLLEGGRKTASGIAGRYGGDVQALPHFVSQRAVGRESAAHPACCSNTPPDAGVHLLPTAPTDKSRLEPNWRGLTSLQPEATLNSPLS
jgi:hypothetical protein